LGASDLDPPPPDILNPGNFGNELLMSVRGGS
jgi:hypothetical protein